MKSILRTIFVLICGGVAILSLSLAIMPMLNRVAMNENDWFVYYKFPSENASQIEETANLVIEFPISTESILDKFEGVNNDNNSSNRNQYNSFHTFV